MDTKYQTLSGFPSLSLVLLFVFVFCLFLCLDCLVTRVLILLFLLICWICRKIHHQKALPFLCSALLILRLFGHFALLSSLPITVITFMGHSQGILYAMLPFSAFRTIYELSRQDSNRIFECFRGHASRYFSSIWILFEFLWFPLSSVVCLLPLYSFLLAFCSSYLSSEPSSFNF